LKPTAPIKKKKRKNWITRMTKRRVWGDVRGTSQSCKERRQEKHKKPSVRLIAENMAYNDNKTFTTRQRSC
jgi:hypothetical protein